MNRAGLSSLHAIPGLARMAARYAIPNACAAVTAACAHGRLRLAQWIIAIFRPVFDLGETMRHRNCYLLRAVCAGGHLDILQWLTQNADVLTSDLWRRDGEALYLAGANNHIPLLIWLLLRLLRLRSCTLWRRAWVGMCSSGNVPLLGWLTRHENVFADAADLVRKSLAQADLVRKSLAQALRCGQLPVARWLIMRFQTLGILSEKRELSSRIKDLCRAQTADAAQSLDGIILCDVPRTITGLLEIAAATGQLNALRWLVDTARPSHAEIADSAALALACHYGHASVVEWASDQIGGPEMVTHEDIAMLITLFRSACGRGHLDVARLLLSRIRTMDPRAMLYLTSFAPIAIRGGNPALLCWLARQNHTATAVTKHRDARLFRLACSRGIVAMVRCVAHMSSTSVRQLSALADGRDCLAEAYDNGHMELLRWLATELQLSPAMRQRYEVD